MDTNVNNQGHIVCFTDSLGSGGAQRQLVGLACMLKERGYDISVVLYYDAPFYKPMLDDANIESMVVTNSNYIGRIWAMYKYFKKNKGATIIAYQETPSLIACLLRPFIRCPKLIVSERNTTQVLSKKDRFRFWLYRFADHVVPNSYSQADFICKHYPKLEKKVTTITNFVDTEYFHPINRANFAQTRTNTIVVVGSNKPQKNFHRFVDAVKIANEEGIKMYVKWYGILPEFIDEHKEYVDSLGLGEIISIYGPTQNIYSEYQSADFFCLPSLFEGFPNVLCEAMSCGLPVACSNVCDNPYIISCANGGVVFNPLDVNDIASGLKRLVSVTDEEWHKNSITNRTVAVALFSKNSFVRKYCDLI